MQVSYRGNYWVVGDDHFGDPRNEGRWLRERYFQEDPTKPLCKVDLFNECGMSSVTIDVWALPGHIFVYDMDANGRPKFEAESRFRQEALGVLELKARLRGMVLTKHRPAAFSAQLPLIDAKIPGEPILLERVKMTVPPSPAKGH